MIKSFTLKFTFMLMLLCSFSVVNTAYANNESLFDKYKLSTEEQVPDDQLYKIVSNPDTMVGSGPGYSTAPTNNAPGQLGILKLNDTIIPIHAKGDDNPFLAMKLYDHTASMPLTKFVLGTAKLDFAAAIKVAEVFSFLRQKVNEVTNEQVMSEMRLHDTNPSVSGSLTAIKEVRSEIFKTLEENAPKIQEIIDASAKAFLWVMTGLPFLILICVFFLQGMNFMMGKVMRAHQAQGISPVYLVLKLFVWVLMILSFKTMMIELVDFSNLISLNIASIESQRALNTLITTKAFTFALDSTGGTLSSLVISICGWLVTCSITIMIISRDIFMAINFLLGPTCFAFGYYKSFTGDQNALSEFMSGWFGNFVKLLLWGIVTAIMITAMGAFSVIMPASQSSVVYAAMMAICFFMAAKNIPEYSDKLSVIVISTLLMAVPGTMGKYATHGTKTVAIGATKFAGKAVLGGAGALLGGIFRRRNRSYE